MGVLRSQWPSFLQSPNPEPPLEGQHGHRGQRHDQETRSRRVRATCCTHRDLFWPLPKGRWIVLPTAVTEQAVLQPGGCFMLHPR